MIDLVDCHIFFDLGEPGLNDIYQNILSELKFKVINFETSGDLEKFCASDFGGSTKVCVKLWQDKSSYAIIEEIKHNFPEIKVVAVSFLADDQLLTAVKKSGADGLIPLLGLPPLKVVERLQTIVNNS